MEGAKLKRSVEQEVTIVKEPGIKLHVNKGKWKGKGKGKVHPRTRHEGTAGE